MAELVDALVSKTNKVTLVPVRSRLRVQKTVWSLEEEFGGEFLTLSPNSKLFSHFLFLKLKLFGHPQIIYYELKKTFVSMHCIDSSWCDLASEL